MWVHLAHFPRVLRGDRTGFKNLGWGLDRDGAGPSVERRDVFVGPTVATDISHRVRPLWHRYPAGWDLRHEVVPPVAHGAVAVIRGVDAIAQQLRWELGEVDGDDALAGRRTGLHNAGDEGSELRGLWCLCWPRGANDHGN